MSAVTMNYIRLTNRFTNEEVGTASISNDISKIAKGIFAELAAIPVLDYLCDKVCELLSYFKFDISTPQDAVLIWESLESIGSSMLRGLAKGALAFYIVILGPLLEELLFRGCFNAWVKEKMVEQGYDLANIWHYALYLTICGAVFGACHLSPFQGWANIPIFVGTTLMGMLFSALKDEETGDVAASASAHMTHNGIGLAFLVAGKA